MKTGLRGAPHAAAPIVALVDEHPDAAAEAAQLVRQRVFTGVEQLAGEQGLGEGPRAHELGGFCSGIGVFVDQRDDGRRRVRRAQQTGFHGVSKNSQIGRASCRDRV